MRRMIGVALVAWAVGSVVLSSAKKVEVSRAPDKTDPNWVQERLEDLRLKIQKIEALITLMKSEQDDMKEAMKETQQAAQKSEPLRESDFRAIQLTPVSQPIPKRTGDPLRNLPSWELEMIEQGKSKEEIDAEWARRYDKREAPGMEPAAQPTRSVPVAPARQVPVGHWERVGLLGRRVWVWDSPQVYQQQAYQQQPRAQQQGQRVFYGGCASGACRRR